MTAVTISLAESGDSTAAMSFMICTFLGFVLWGVKRQRSPRGRFYRAFAEQDFAAALGIAAANPKLRKEPATRYNLALLETISGDPEFGITELEELARRYPKFRLPPITLSMALLNSGQAERAWQAASDAALKTPKDPLPHAQAARALRMLGRCDEARSAAQRAHGLDGDYSLAESLLGGLALDAGALDEAQRHVTRALDLAPGDPFALAVQAEIQLAGGDLPAAELTVQAAIAAARANPFTLMKHELAALEQRLVESRTTPSCVQDPGVRVAN